MRCSHLSDRSLHVASRPYWILVRARTARWRSAKQKYGSRRSIFLHHLVIQHVEGSWCSCYFCWMRSWKPSDYLIALRWNIERISWNSDSLCFVELNWAKKRSISGRWAGRVPDRNHRADGVTRASTLASDPNRARSTPTTNIQTNRRNVVPNPGALTRIALRLTCRRCRLILKWFREKFKIEYFFQPSCHTLEHVLIRICLAIKNVYKLLHVFGPVVSTLF